MDITFKSTNMESLNREYQQLAALIQEQFLDQIKEAQQKNDSALVERLSRQLQDNIEKLSTTFQSKHKALYSEILIYQKDLCSLNLDRVVYEGDRDYLLGFEQDPDLGLALRQKEDVIISLQPNKKRLEVSVRLTSESSPDIYKIGEKCRDILGFKRDIELYVYEDEKMRAFSYLLKDNNVHIFLSSGLLEKLNHAELTNVIGHELGHALFSHHNYPTEYLMEIGIDYLSSFQRMKLYSWRRSAEISADRIGLLCCQNLKAAFSSFQKLYPDAIRASRSFNIRDISPLIGDNTSNEEYWYYTHPLIPIRIKALDLYEKSQVYRQLSGQKGGSLSRDDMEKDIKQMLSLMDPPLLADESEFPDLIQKYTFLAGYILLRTSHRREDFKLQSLKSLTSEEVFTSTLKAFGDKDKEIIEAELRSLSSTMNIILSPVQKRNLLLELLPICSVEDEIDRKVIKMLYDLSYMLQIDSEFIDRVLADEAKI
ncbi:M48 family metallopeptidase [Spirochaeta cellobiosiphila]|uniref:M48 family metallopeptidase n=1 Tax=Spirochaeta cellobiosiphila TaxID=504483 RepID=UPI0003FAE049|nr:M48 family metallopeptidase [Spirochaeta cellobiosiphila]